jgi:hypothetical protein
MACILPIASTLMHFMGGEAFLVRGDHLIGEESHICYGDAEDLLSDRSRPGSDGQPGRLESRPGPHGPPAELVQSNAAFE